MAKYNVIGEKAVPAHIETVQSEDGKYTFIRLRIDTRFGSVYVRPSFNSREYITLDIVNKSNN